MKEAMAPGRLSADVSSLAIATRESPFPGEALATRRTEIEPGYTRTNRRSLPLIAYLALLVVIFILAAAAGTYYSYDQARASAQRNAAADGTFAAASAARDISASISTLQDAVAKLAATPGLAAVFASAGGCTLSFAGSGDFTSGHLDITRADGSVACSSQSNHSQSYQGMPWLAQALGAPVFVGPVNDPASGKASFVSASPVKGNGGVVAGWVSLEPLGPALAARLAGPRHLEFLVTSQDGLVALARSIAPARWVGATLAGTPFAQSSGVNRPDITGTARIYGSATVAKLGWVVYAGADRAATLAEADSVFNRELAIILIGLATMLLATMLVYRQITGPIRQMSQAIRLARKRGFAGPVKVHGSTEVMILADDYNALVAAVEHELARRKQAESEIQEQVLARTAELRAVNMELEAFTYTVSHDLRAPLRAIDGFVGALVEDHGDQLAVEAREFLDDVATNAKRMGTLIDDLLAFSRLGRQPSTFKRVYPSVIARQVLEDLGGQMKGRDVRVKIGKLPPCRADPSLLTQVFANLLSNAIKYTRPRKVAEIEVGHSQEAEGAAYFVKDNGVGFNPAYQDKLFGVFQRLHGEDEFEGTGVGLAIVQRVVQRHGGRVWAQSRPGEGATFFFTLGGVPAAIQ
jgi:signal transduction histidine kinase